MGSVRQNVDQDQENNFTYHQESEALSVRLLSASQLTNLKSEMEAKIVVTCQSLQSVRFQVA